MPTPSTIMATGTSGPPFGGRIGYPTLLANEILRLFFLLCDVRPFVSGLHAKNELEFLRPVKRATGGHPGQAHGKV